MDTTLIEKGVSCTDVLRTECQRIKELFRQYDDASSDRQKKAIGDEALRRVEMYVILDEEVFYPAVRRVVGERHRVVKGLAAHQVAKLLIRELKNLPSGEHFNARFGLLRDNVLQQIDIEENELLPRVEKSDLDLEVVGAQMIQLRDRVLPERLNLQSGGTAKAAVAAVAGLAAVGAVAWLVNKMNETNKRFN